MSDEIHLTPEERELETALRSLWPMPARINPLPNERPTTSGRTRGQQLAAAAALILAAGGAWLALNARDPAPLRVEPQIATQDSPLEPPTLLVYRRALAESPAALDAMLNRQAATRPRRNDQDTPVQVLRLWYPDFSSSLGEM